MTPPLRLAHFDDLHTEHGAWEAPELPGVDVITLGGDIAGSPQDYFSVVAALHDRNPAAKIIGILGNHEHYGREILSSTKEYAALSGKVVNFELLTGCRAVEHEGWRFIGTTLWTDIPEKYHLGVQIFINDFRKIMLGDRRLLPSDVGEVHRASVAKLERVLAGDNDRTVVLTHHAPSLRSWTWTGREAEDREGLQSVYCANLDRLIERTQPALWLHGHIHSPADYTIGRTRVANNARGYYRSNALNAAFIDDGLRIDLMHEPLHTAASLAETTWAGFEATRPDGCSAARQHIAQAIEALPCLVLQPWESLHVIEAYGTLLNQAGVVAGRCDDGRVIATVGGSKVSMAAEVFIALPKLGDHIRFTRVQDIFVALPLERQAAVECSS